MESMDTSEMVIEETLETKSAISYKKFPLADPGEAWNGPAEVSAASVEDLMLMCAWYDRENPEIKTSYKLPHHKQAAGHATVWRAVAAAGAAIQGGRGGVNIPAGDVAGVKAHLAQHYREFEKSPPWETGEKSMNGDETEHKVIEIMETKKGAVFNVSNLKSLKAMRSMIDAMIKQMEGDEAEQAKSQTGPKETKTVSETTIEEMKSYFETLVKSN